MNHLPSHPPQGRPPQVSPDELQVRNWLRLRRELAELHARLEFLQLMMRMGAAR